MSKSGVFAHFGSREELQISVVREYHAKFEDEVFRPAMRAPRGLPRLRALFDRWVRRVSVEIDSRLHLHQRRGRVRRPARPGARRARDDGADLAERARARDPRRRRRRPPARRHRRRASCCSRSTASFLRFITTRASCATPAPRSAPAPRFERLLAHAATPAQGSARRADRRLSALAFDHKEPSCPPTPRRCATCASSCTRCSTSSAR